MSVGLGLGVRVLVHSVLRLVRVRVRGRRGGALVEGQRVGVRSALAGHVELEVEQAPALSPCTIAAAVVRVRRRCDQADQVVHLVQPRRSHVGGLELRVGPRAHQRHHRLWVVRGWRYERGSR